MDGSDGATVALWVAIAVAVGLGLFGDCGAGCGTRAKASPAASSEQKAG